MSYGWGEEVEEGVEVDWAHRQESYFLLRPPTGKGIILERYKESLGLGPFLFPN
jgi:hypothetical protein